MAKNLIALSAVLILVLFCGRAGNCQSAQPNEVADFHSISSKEIELLLADVAKSSPARSSG